jgi:hypothetical protein
MIDVKNSLKENKKRLKNKKEDTKGDNTNNSNSNVIINKDVPQITINNASETVYYTADEDEGITSDNDEYDN